MEMDQQKPHIAILLSPGIGHLIPLIELAKVLALHYNFHVTCIIPTIGPPSKAMRTVLEALPTSIDRVFLPPVNSEDLHTVHPGIQICRAITLSLPSLRDVFKCLVSTIRLAAFVVDVIGCEALEVAKEFRVTPYVFVSASATFLSLSLHMPKLDETVQGEFRELPEPLKLPGWSIPIQGRDLLDPLQDRQTEAYKLFLSLVKRLRLAEGIMVNTFMDLEGRTIKALDMPEYRNPPIFPIGPIIQTGSSTNHVDESGCISWLENQPSGSVLFVSFGSGGTLSFDQLTELALGLELSGQSICGQSKSSGTSCLFTKRVRGKNRRARTSGALLGTAARILSHSSTGGFLTHCGWNSTLESIASGIPLIAWPLFAEQRMNAVVLTEDLKVALRPKANEEGLIEREEIARVIKDLMASEEGKRVQNRMKDLKIAAEKALTGDGSSKRALSELASKMASN
ncbi:Hydroquinone glucosyltransferase [Morella rubra]|uniref:Hydroquinone glucosyltransferase n=1 Tax=Morella rubra TaxID=262757 RepID=A0A6A1WIU6_9ROSI|nr:Hydroquinone glucosyltransferase [Morella rubra]